MTNSIHVTDLDCRYGRVQALTGVTVEFPIGSITALIGDNGSGKSTLLEALAGTLQPTKGSITGLPKNIAYVTQRSQASDQLPISVQRTVEMGRWRSRGALKRLRKEDHEVVATSLKRMGMSDLASRRLGDLSGGQRQRVLVAQGLAQQATLLLLDEPLAAVDGTAAQFISEAIASEAKQGVTIILATHSIEQAKEADAIITLTRGKVSAAQSGHR